jgi:hypothetical protein
MSPKRFSTFLNISGIILDVLGLLLPWAEWSWVPGVYAESNYVLGIKNQRLSLGFLMASGIVTMIFSFASVIDPYPLHSSSRIYTASYGAYVSFAGGALILIGAAFSSWTWHQSVGQVIRQDLSSGLN